MLRIEKLVKNYGKFRALNGLSMEIEKGELFGFIGPNGAGKTTTIKIMTGLLKADSGHVYLDGRDALKDVDNLKQKIGYVPDFFGVYDNLKAIEYMEFYASTYGLTGKEVRKRCFDLMEQVGLEGRSDVYVDELSRGMQQRLCLARAMIHKPDLLILDEPASGLDPRSRFEMKAILKELCRKGTTILISSHILSELAEMCSSIGIIKKGELLQQGSIDEIVSAVNTANPILVRVCDEQKKTLDFLRENPMVQTLAIDGQEFQFTFTGSAKEEAKLLNDMVTQGIHVLSFGRKRDNLETIFMQLTREGEEG
ncbi:MAG: ABC transporter ATP-binding protein [Lachnospiraceae bacterium]|nr:ABC transporter ATP-binding protein [Lachnospiraceae bacterium]